MKNYGLVSRLRASAAIVADGVNQIFRQNQIGEIIAKMVNQDQYAQEGSYFSTTNATIGTGVALGVAAATTFNATAPAITIRNTDAIGGKDIILKGLSLITTGAGTAGTDLNCVVVVDSTNRVTSGGTAQTVVNTRADSGIATIASVLSATAAIVASAAGGTARLLARMRIRTGAPVVGDTYKIAFGAEPTTETGALSGTAASLFAQRAPSCVVPPGGTALIYLWSAAQTAAPAYEWQLEFAER